MEALAASVTLLLPLITGLLLARQLLAPGTPGRVPTLVGLGLLIGLLVGPLILLALHALNLALDRGAALPGAGVLFGAAVASSLLRPPVARTASAVGATVAPEGPGPAWQRVVFVVLVGMIALRLGTVGAEALLRPLYPWDALMHWATKAKAWFHLGELAPFLSNRDWLDASTGAAYTDHHADYPPLVPLLQVWSAVALARWDEVTINLAWPLLGLALPLLFYGYARRFRVRPLVAVTFAYFLVSLPLLDTHLALAGYADLVLGTVYLAALLAAAAWLRDGDRRQLGLALALLLACTQIKNEGFFWALTGGVLLAWPLLRGPRLLPALAVSLVTMPALLFILPQDLVVAGHSLASLDLQYHPGAFPALLFHLFATDSWHLLGLLLVATPGLAWYARRDLDLELGLLLALGAALILYLVLFCGTDFSDGALRLTASGRIGLHLTPALTFLAMLLYAACERRAEASVAVRAAPPAAPQAPPGGAAAPDSGEAPRA